MTVRERKRAKSPSRERNGEMYNTAQVSQQNYLKSYEAAKRLSDISPLIYHEREMSGWKDSAEKMDSSKP